MPQELYGFEGARNFSAVWVYNSGTNTYTNNTIAARSTLDANFTIFANSSDFLYVGFESRFDLMTFEFGTTGVLTMPLTWQYLDETQTWAQFVPGYEFDFTFNGAERFDLQPGWWPTAFSSTFPHAVAPPDTRTRYWIRVQAPTPITTSPTVSRIEMRPWTSYCTPTDVAALLQVKQDFSTETVPTRAQVEDFIHAAQSKIEFGTRRSWRLNYQDNELHQFNIGGFKLKHRYPIRLAKLEVWNGAQFELRREGRTLDYFLVDDVGMVFFSRYFLLPARLQSYNAPVWLWGWAEFNFPIQVSYVYGAYIKRYPHEEGVAFDITRKQAAVDLINTLDYNILTVSGLDKVSMVDKARNWEEEIQDRMDMLAGWEVF